MRERCSGSTGPAALATAGVLFALYPAVRPWGDATAAGSAAAFASPSSVVAHLAAVAGFVLLSLGLLSVRAAVAGGPGARAAGAAVVVVVVVTWIGTGLTLPYYGAKTFALHALGQRVISTGDDSLLGLVEEIRMGPTQLTTFGIGLVLLGVGAVLGALGCPVSLVGGPGGGRHGAVPATVLRVAFAAGGARAPGGRRLPGCGGGTAPAAADALVHRDHLRWSAGGPHDTIEHMFEAVVQLFVGRESALEEWLRAAVDELVYELADDYETHGSPSDVVGEVVPGAARLAEQIEAGADHLALAREAHRVLAGAAADQASALAAFARSRPASLDRPDSEIGAAAASTRAARPAALTPVSEWAVDEVAVALQVSGAAATDLLVESITLDERLPGTLRALREGRISWAHARVMTKVVSPLADDVRGEAEDRLLARVAGKTPAQLRAAAQRLVQRLDAESVARRVRQAIRERRVVVYAGDDGMATLSAVLPAPVARAMRDALEQYADAAAVEGDERTRAQRMVDCLVDLVLRPGEHGLPPVQARLTIVAAVETLLGGSGPGEVDGDLVPAEMVRQLAIALGLLPRPEPTVVEDGESGPQPAVAEDQESGQQPSARPLPDGRDALADLLRINRISGTALAERPHVALVDELNGQLLALADATSLRRGSALGPPGASPRYRPGEELDRFVRLRDRRCRFPGCRARPRRCDLDHTVPWPWGPTSHDNLCCLCRHHHRLSHQAPGWRLRATADGGLEWTTPTGQVATTHPPRFGADDDLPPAPPGADDGPPPAPSAYDPPPF
ncbi:HNH endonuclease signature motif containing protein [Modestobacter marinus]|uniref:HNH endonuclease signature motif containing protein n=1 Tax=Modestobacter marinus TaxID=477641 RepID=UPI001C97EFD6|nr:HNH endonuclease signature motif containing protein [Modestobacter marinus]